MKQFISKVIVFTIIPIVFVLMLEVIAYSFIPKISHHKIKAKGQLLIPKVDSNSILILGDSRLEWGLKTHKIINENGNVLNLAMPGSNGFDVIQYLITNKIYPKLIILGFTPNYYRYENHKLNKMHFSITNLLKESSKYWLMQNSYIYEMNSILLFIKGKQPYFIRHVYDNQGNVVVKEKGCFKERFKLQLEMYKRWYEEFDEKKYKRYLLEMKDLISQFEGKTSVYGLYMPVSDTLRQLEEYHYNKLEVVDIFDYFMDYSNARFESDSIHFYDGSHLTPEFAIQFTDLINQDIKNKMNN